MRNIFIIVASWINFLWYPAGWTEVDSFHVNKFDWEKIKAASKYFEIYQSDNDDIPTTEGEELSKKLDGKLILVPGAGHFNTGAGYTTFPLLLENIKKKL